MRDDSPKWSNLETASPLCKHMLEDEMADESSPMTQLGEFFKGREGFRALIRSAYAKLYADDAAPCKHTTRGR